MKLYLFCIGGTGSRVLRSLTMLLASGVKINADEIVPVVVDADFANKDLERTRILISEYNAIRNKLTFDETQKNKFWGTKINTSNLDGSLLLPLDKPANNKDFGSYIGFSSMPKESQALVSMLFSDRDLGANMTVGFEGHPNIGSVVLNQFSDITEFKRVLSSFEDGDRIFVVSSIFGGTGASGFPLLVKNLRKLGTNFTNIEAIQNSIIGAITVLPYFRLELDSNSTIESSRFPAQTRAALDYYKDHLTETNVLYYVGDRAQNEYVNCKGGNKQKNDAHVVELISALSIIDFMSISNESVLTKNGTPQNPIYKEFGIKGDDMQSLVFDDFSDTTNEIMRRSMSQFLLFGKYIKYHKERYAWPKNASIEDSFFTSDFYKKVVGFIDSLFEWYKELESNKRSFGAFDLEHKPKALFEFVKGVKVRRLVFRTDSNYDLYGAYLNEISKKELLDNNTKEQRFIELFYRATDELLKDKLGW